jgi:putative copper resistance protein D
MISAVVLAAVVHLSESGMAGMHMGASTPTRLDLHTALTGWETVGVVRGKGRSWNHARTVAFIAGLACIELALGSAVATLSMTMFTAHITQHLLLMVVGPPLLALGAPSTLLLSTADRRLRRAWLQVLHSAPFTVLTHPIVVWAMYYGAMFAFFLSPLLGNAMEHPATMDLWNLGFLFGAACFWWPMVGLDPIPRWRMGYGMRFVNLLIGVPFESFLGIALMSLHSPVAPMYSLSSSHDGGALLWGMTELFTVVAMGPIFVQWSRSDLREGRRMDARLDAEAAAVAAGVALPARPAGPDPARQRGLAATFSAIRREP